MSANSHYYRFLYAIVAIAVTLLGARAASAGAEPDGRPNILLVLIDDAGFADFPYFQDGRQRMPNLDRLCDEGLRFTQFYVNSPICSPSRAAFVTGQYAIRWGITSYIDASDDNARRGMRDWLEPSAPSLARILHEAGYATAHFGKWHLGGGRDIVAPLIGEYGFDESLTQFEGMGDRILPLLDAGSGRPPVKFSLGVASERLGHGKVRWVERSQETSEFVKPAIKFMERAAAAGKPFYVNVWPDDVHTPLHPPQHLRGDGSKRELYLGVLENMDRQLAELFDFIRNDPQLSRNTIIVVASDNGFEPGAGSAGPLRGSKGNLYEGGVREPLVVWGPGLLEKKAIGSTNDQTVISSIDVVASLLEIVGVELPANVQFDGEDLSAALTGVRPQQRTKPLCWVRPPDRPGQEGENLPDLAIRSGNWKLLTEYDGSHPQLYDIASDPNEQRDLAQQHPEMVQTLTSELLDWHRAATPTSAAATAPRQFANPIFEGADPWIIQHDGKYIACLSDGNRAVALHFSDDLTKLGPKHIVWEAPATGPYSREVWAPELHHLDDRWYIYVAADDGDNRNHLSYVLESKGDDPLGPYELRGPIYTGDDPAQKKDNRWAIDATVFEHHKNRLLIWSGWAADSDEQWLYIAPLKSPWELAGPRVRLCHNADHQWERVGELPDQRGLHEGPQILQHDGRTFIIYSASSSWQPTYKLGMLELQRDGEPLNPADWIKHDQPVFVGTEDTYGVGHASFVKSPDGAEDWIVYHAKRDRSDGWARAVFAHPFTWGADGRPCFGAPVKAGELLKLPSGTPAPAVKRGACDWPTFHSLEGWTYYGHHQMLKIDAGQLLLGVPPKDPANTYRSGEKAVLNDGRWSDLKVAATIRVLSGDRDAGILFRVQRPAVGFDAQQGYFAGIIPGSDRVILGATDGRHWRHIADAPADVEVGKDYRLEATARGDSITLALDGRQVLQATDAAFTRGSIGLRVVDSEAAFSNVSIEPLKRRPQRPKPLRAPAKSASSHRSLQPPGQRRTTLTAHANQPFALCAPSPLW
ncbi:sulfatase-like hydrolase/transferase [Lacipirellula limnantheis]|uniref:Extracellular exo-alpha-(1->5)-L-arabinofuranosidase n=1 Tax=Lacipirellula limnantheis TaxID=2528024 RepID=A0A517U0H2_9BACT|nr:sulfatase-like hydrolase/transferase [Lacipirellula limnantheis]QDT74124.1 Extracellular exo-alpha-(1->5)-L-arabinofuranosidase precursor [Lacipirellula limnantheis]